MTRNELNEKTNVVVSETTTALQTVYDALNSGQKKKILKDEMVAALFERYGVNTNAD